MSADGFLLTVRVKPGAGGERVGGTWGDDPDGPLNVAVTKPAVDGAANKAVIALVGRVLKVRPRQLTITSGHKGRTKTILVSDPPAGLARLVAELKAR